MSWRKLKQPLHLGTAKIQIAVLQPDRLRHFGIVFDHERRRLGLVQNLDGIDEHLDVPGRQIGILRFFRTGHDLARDRHDTLAPQGVGRLMHRRITLGIEDHLRDSRPVTQIDEHAPCRGRAAAAPSRSRRPSGRHAALVQLSAPMGSDSSCHLRFLRRAGPADVARSFSLGTWPCGRMEYLPPVPRPDASRSSTSSRKRIGFPIRQKTELARTEITERQSAPSGSA